MIKIHKKTNQRLLLIRDSGLVSTLYVLDAGGNKIKETNNKGRVLYDIHGNTRYKVAICQSKNLKDE